MGEIRSRIVQAGVTATVFFNRIDITSKLRISNVDLSMSGVDRTVACISGGENAIEKITAIFDCHEKIFRLAYSQKMPRLFFRQYLIDPLNCCCHVFLCKRSSNAKTVKLHSSYYSGTFFSQIFMPTALDNTKECLAHASDFLMMQKTALRPAVRSIQCFALIMKRLCRRCTFIKCKHNICSDVMLNLNRFFWSEIMS